MLELEGGGGRKNLPDGARPQEDQPHHCSVDHSCSVGLPRKGHNSPKGDAHGEEGQGGGEKTPRALPEGSWVLSFLYHRGLLRFTSLCLSFLIFKWGYEWPLLHRLLGRD